MAALLHNSCADMAVLVGVSSTCSMSSCLTISSASNAWSGESEPEEAGGENKCVVKDVTLEQQATQ